MESLLAILDFFVLLAHCVVIPICFLKGRLWLGWFGLFMFGTGAALSFPLFLYVRDGLVDEWWQWVFNAQGLAVLVLLASITASAARPGSWRDRRDAEVHGMNGPIGPAT
jgi:hypothetical protein